MRRNECFFQGEYDEVNDKLEITDQIWKEAIDGIPICVEDTIRKYYLNVYDEIKKAIEEFHTKTVVRFKLIDYDKIKNYPSYIIIYYSDSITCSGNVGKSIYQAEHSIWIQSSIPSGGILHEIMHVLGFKHEHQRPDRDDYASVTSSEGDYFKDSEGSCIGQYDPDSVMHYAWDECIKPNLGGKLTKEQIKKLNNFPKGLSVLDVQGINSVYGNFIKCTYNDSKRDFIKKPFFECITCWGKNSQVVCCPSCREKCHTSHDVKYHPGDTETFFCDCGVMKHTLKCTVVPAQNEKIKQQGFKCLDCNKSKDTICFPCSKKCHKNHQIKDIGSQFFSCSCDSNKCLKS